MRKYTSPSPFFTNDIPVLTGKVAIVTGANCGIGLETARELARKGADVILTARSKSKGDAAVAEIKASVARQLTFEPKVRYLQLDLASLNSIEEFSANFLKLGLPLHMLILNAGVMKSPGAQYIGQEMTYGYDTTADGFEMHIGVNHIGHHYLTSLLTHKLKSSAPARVVSVSSGAEEGSYEGGFRFDLWTQRGDDYEDGKAYAQSKLANALFARELAKRLDGTGVTAYSCHPGVIQTELTRYMTEFLAEQSKKKGPIYAAMDAGMQALFQLALFSTADGALTQLHLATSPDLPVNGGFYHPIGQLAHLSHKAGADDKLPSLLWTKTEEAILAALKSSM